jgi:hypothetical protein
MIWILCLHFLDLCVAFERHLLNPGQFVPLIRGVLGLGREDKIVALVTSTGTADVYFNAHAPAELHQSWFTLHAKRHKWLTVVAAREGVAVIETGSGFGLWDSK